MVCAVITQSIGMLLFIFFFFNDTAATEIYTLPYTTLFRSAASVVDLPLPVVPVTRTRPRRSEAIDRKSTRLNSSHVRISYAVFCLKKKNRYRLWDILSQRR